MANRGSAEIQYSGITVSDISDAMLVEVQQVFEADIVPMAKELSPVDKGTNRRSITSEAHRTPDGIQAEMFTQSGYGGYLELGHKVHGAGKGGFDFDAADFVQGRPYLYPAFMAYIGKLLDACKNGVGKLRKG